MGFIILALVVGALLTNFANNFVIAIIIMPVIYSFSMQTGMAPLGPIMVLFVCTQMAVGTPGASFPVAICYSFSEIVDAPMMMKYAWLSVVIMIIICLAVALPLRCCFFKTDRTVEGFALSAVLLCQEGKKSLNIAEASRHVNAYFCKTVCLYTAYHCAIL